MKLNLKFLCALFSLGLAANFAMAADVLKIGFVGPLTGDNAQVGQDSKAGIELAIEQMRSQLPFEVETIYEDNQLQNKLAHTAAMKLIQADHVNAIVSIWTDAAYVVAPLCEKYGVMQFNSGWDVDPAQNQWTLVRGGNFRQYAQKSVEIMKAAGVKRLGITSVVEKGVLVVIEAAKPYLEEAGIEIVFNEPYAPGTRDFRTYLLKLKDAHPDFVWHLNHAPEDAMIFQTMANMGLSWPSSGFYFYTSPTLYPYVEGAYFPQISATDSFDDAFEAKFGRLPSYIEAANAYDIARVIIVGAKVCYENLGRLPSNEELLSELRRPKQLDFLSVGPGRMTDEGWVETPYHLSQIRDGQIVRLRGE